MTHPSVTIQITPESAPSLPSWMGEVAAFAQVLTHVGLLKAIQKHVQFARARFGTYDTIDFVVVLLGYALSGEGTLQAFYERLSPFADVFMALFERDRLPDRSTLSRFLSALDQTTVEALRTQFQDDLLARSPFASVGGLWDRCDQQYVVVDVDGTRQAARQRALPQLPSLPAPHRRFDQVAAPGYKGRKRGEVVRTRTSSCPPKSWYGWMVCMATPQCSERPWRRGWASSGVVVTMRCWIWLRSRRFWRVLRSRSAPIRKVGPPVPCMIARTSPSQQEDRASG